MLTTIIILALAIVGFISGKIRSDIVALCALLALIAFGILTPEEGLSGFSNSVVIMMVGLFVVGGAIVQTGLAKVIGGKIIQLAGDNETKLFLLVIIVTAFIGAFVSNTGTVALMMPIVVSLAARSNINTSRLLMPLAFASSLGGMTTLIGTPPNMVISNTLEANDFKGLEFFDFTISGLVCIAVGIIVLLPLSKLFLVKAKTNSNTKKFKSLDQLVKEYKLDENINYYKITEASKLINSSLKELDIYKRYGISVLEVRKEDYQGMIVKNIRQEFAGPNTILHNNDIIILSGEIAAVQSFALDYNLQEYKSTKQLNFYDIGIAEIVVLRTSRFVNNHIKDIGLRDKFCINIVGIQRKDNYIMDNLAKQTLKEGDILLVQASWNNISKLSSESEDWVVLGQPLEQAAKVTLDYKAPIAAAIMILMVCLMVFDFIPIAPVTAVLIASVLMILTGCFRNVESAYKTINWESIILIGAMMPMSIALEKTGAAALVSKTLVDLLGSIGPYALLAGIFFTTSLMTMFISNTATAVLMAPIALSAATAIGVSPYSFVFAVTLGASLCFASPFSTPPNALVMQAGHYTFMDYIKVGLPLQIILGIVMIFVLPLIFPF